MGLFGYFRPGRSRRARTCMTIAITSSVAALAVGCAGSAVHSASPARSSGSSTATTQHASSSGDAIHFPATLLGLARNTSPAYEQAIRSGTQLLTEMGVFTHPEAALYGSSTGPLILVAGAEWSARAKKYGVAKISAASARKGFLIQGSPGARAFPAGALGARLACGHVKRAGLTEIDCAWFDKKGVAVVVYFPGSASNLTDAAARTNRAVSAIGG